MSTDSPPINEKIPVGARGANNYPHWWLRFYDWWVLGVTSTYAWACSVKKHQLPFFSKHVSPTTHLDVGVGTGYYLARSVIPKTTKITLLDLNVPSLEVARLQVQDRKEDEVECIKHDIFEPLDPSRKFGSISMFYFLHCLPGPVEKKMEIFNHLKHNLLPADTTTGQQGGVIYGTTILGPVTHNLFGKATMRLCNHVGTFDNWEDGVKGMESGFREHFREVEVRVVGTILFFAVRDPIL